MRMIIAILSLLKAIAKILLIIFCIYIFCKGIREKNKKKIIISIVILMILLDIAMKSQTNGYANIFLIFQMLFYIFIWILIITLPYIVGIIISAISILVIKKITTGKKQEIFCTIIIVICSFTVLTIKPLYYKYASAVPNETYVKMKKMDDNKSLLGLSKEQVVEMIGQRKSKQI